VGSPSLICNQKQTPRNAVPFLVRVRYSPQSVAGPVEYSDTGALANLAPLLHANTQSAYVCGTVENRWNSWCNANNASFLPRLYFYASTSLHLHSSIRPLLDAFFTSSLLRSRTASSFYQISFLSLRSCPRPSFGLRKPPYEVAISFNFSTNSLLIRTLYRLFNATMLVHSFRRQLVLLSFLAFSFFVTFFRESPYLNNLDYDEFSFGSLSSPSPAVAPENSSKPASQKSSAPDVVDMPEEKPSLTTMNPETHLYSTGIIASSSKAPEPINKLDYMANMLKWNRPGKGNNHWPPYGDYHHSDYDPNRWEGFEMYVSVAS